MGIPDDNCPVAPAKKRPRLSLKANKQKADTLPKTAEEGVIKSKAVTDVPGNDEVFSDGEQEKTSAESLTSDKDSRVPAVASLENFGNTCFMNSILQVLRYTPGFLDNLAQLFQDIVASEKIKRKNKIHEDTDDAALNFDEENCKKCWKVVRNVYRVYRDLSLLENKYEEVASDDVMSMAVKPSKVLSSVRELNPMFEGNLQHDAQEFLRCLLCYLQDAEKEVQKFYSQLPPRFSPRAVVLNPIMQRFLKAAQKLGKPQSEASSNQKVDNNANIKVERNEDVKSDAVKVNLFPKGDITVEEKTEAAKSPSKIQVAPNLGDTASVVDKKSSTNIQSGTVPKADSSDSNDVKMEGIVDNSGLTAEPSLSTKPSRNRSMARRGRGYKSYKMNASSRAEKQGECKQTERTASSKKGKKCTSPVDKLQPCISDMFVTKTYSAKKRLGMTSAVFKKTSEELFDEIKASSKVEKPAMNTISPRKSHSVPILNDSSYNVNMQPVVSLTDLHNKISPDIKNERKDDTASNIKFENNLADINVNAVSENDIGNIKERPENTKINNAVEEKGADEPNNKSEESTNTADIRSRSFQDMFAKFLQTPIFDSDSDSVDLLTDSDNEDIVMQKKVAKRLHESPRRSPRKQVEMFQASPRKSVSLDIQTAKHEISNLRKTASLDDNKLCEIKIKEVSASPNKSAINLDQATVDSVIRSKDIDVKHEKIDDSLPKQDETNGNTENRLETEIIDRTCAEIGDRNIFPVVKLEKCDHVFEGSSKSVNVNYATRCLTPVKNSPRKSDPDESSNYLKRRNLLADLDIKDEKDLQRAIEEMYNSPVKSRSRCDLIERLFQGSMMLRTRCLQCESSRERREDFHDVSVPVRLEQSDSDDEEDMETDSRCGLMKLIEASTEVEKLLEDNKYYCEECKCYVEAERSMLYDVMPDILTLHLKRFSATLGKFSSITKINDEVEIPFTLPCLRYRCPKVCLRPDHRYSLYAVVTHSGLTLTAGHYLAYVRALPKPTKDIEENLDDLEADKVEEQTDNKVEKEPEIETIPQKNSMNNAKKIPMTRKKMGITAKLPSRFDDSVTDTKVKTFKGMAKNKPGKANLADCLIPSKQFSTEWFECDDETVRVFSEEDFRDMVDGRSGAMLGTPYLLFYHKATMV